MRHAKDDSGQRCVVFDDGTREVWDEERHGEWREGAQLDEPLTVTDEVEVDTPIPAGDGLLEPVPDEPEDVEEEPELSPDEAAALELAEAQAADADLEIAEDEPTDEPL